MTLAEWLLSWLSLRSAALAPRTVEQYGDLIRRIIAPLLGAVALADLTPGQVQQLLAQLCAQGHARTAQLVRVLLHAACGEACACGLLAANPIDRVMRPRAPRGDPRWWSPEELRRFTAAASGSRWALAWQLALCCGLRRGELAGLRWADVDLPAGLLHIRNQRQRIQGGGVIDAPPKSAAGRRDIPIPEGLRPLFAATLAAQRARTAFTGVLPGYVISYTDNRPIDPHALNLALSEAIRAAGVRPINLHGLRHTMATMAVSLGVSIKVLQSLLGHAQYSTTADIYAHVITADQITAIDTISRAVL